MHRFLSLWLALTLCSWAGPLTVKELDLMVRMQVSEAEILRDAETRRLLQAIDPAAEKSLLANGATPRLVAALKQGRFELAQADADAAVAKDAAQKEAVQKARAEDEAAFAEKQRAAGAPPLSPTMVNAFSGRLLRLSATGQPEEVKAESLKDVQLFALYYSAHWCGPCREFTPKLASFYKRFKPAHPEFELIFISSDRDARSMAKYMVEAKMPWPAVRFEKIEDNLRQWSADGIPYLVLVNSAGEAITPEGKRKEWTDPAKTIAQLEGAGRVGFSPASTPRPVADAGWSTRIFSSVAGLFSR